jgi:UDP-N-acetylmuramate: L-alanyl-gamma-D-glutamyl-meso-diaminopimelate ligase
MKVHFIAIGGSAMHNLAIALHHKGYLVTGSDDEIFEPSRSRLDALGLLPPGTGWDPSRVTPDLDAIILGMHARKDNPELLRAVELGLKIFSYPEYLYEQSKKKKRIVIGGSHGKTTITAMILHVLKAQGIPCDFMVGAQLEGFEVMVKLTEDASYMIFEGDEYLTSPIDPRPKFHLYRPDIALISGIAWDHINVFPTFENYLEQFELFIRMITPGGSLIFCEEDEPLRHLALETREDIEAIPYSLPQFVIRDDKVVIQHSGREFPLQVFGRHNLLNLNGARLICNQLGISSEGFYEAIKTFKGASKRLELVARNAHSLVFKDFAHAPSKLKATLRAVREQFPEKHLVACMELHTYSSLSREFLPQYLHSMDEADTAIVYFSPHAISLKRLPPLTPGNVTEGFGRKDLEVLTDPVMLEKRILDRVWTDSVLLMMSSGNFDGLDISRLAAEILKPV